MYLKYSFLFVDSRRFLLFGADSNIKIGENALTCYVRQHPGEQF